jgi:hypothetical protein
MIPPQRSRAVRFAEWTLRQAVCLWPQESREWGRAMAAELNDIQNPLQALRWSFGGVLFFLRSLGAHFLAWTKLPAGANSPGGALLNGEEPPRLPKHSRLVTALLLIGATVVLLLPWGREAVTGVLPSWQGFGLSVKEKWDVEALAGRAEKERDARKLAFAAISDPDSSSAISLAEKAVALDPSLTWIYASRFDRSVFAEMPTRWLKQLQTRDPENGYVYLLAAENNAGPRLREARHGLNEILAWKMFGSDTEKILASDPEWLALMRKAVSAPHYDEYAQLHWELQREIWRGEKNLSAAVIVYSLWSPRIPDASFLKAYENLRIREAEEAQRNGQAKQAEQILKELNEFGNRMAAKSQSRFSQIIGLDFSRQSLHDLRTLYTGPEQQQDAHLVAGQLLELESRLSELQRWPPEGYAAFEASYRRRALVVQLSAAFLSVCALLSLAGIVFLEFSALFPPKRGRLANRLACFAADYGSILLPLACVALLLSFRPFAAAFEQYRNGTGPIADQRHFTEVFFSLWEVPPNWLHVDQSYFGWWVATIALTAVAVFILLRGLIRDKRTAAVTSHS